MDRTTRRSYLACAIAVALMAGGGQRAWTQGSLDTSTDEAVRSVVLTPLDRQILEFVNESQLDELFNGTDPAEIYLSNGETLGRLIARTQEISSRNLLFAPVRACRLIDTRLAPDGSLRSGETRGFAIRESEDGYSTQGGSADGCGLPGLAGVTLKTNTVRAVALNVMTVNVSGPGSLAIWPANRSEPEIGSVSFTGALAGGGVTGGVLVPVCDEAGVRPCGSGDLKIKAKISGAHVVAEVVGYFHAAGSGSPLEQTALSGEGESRDESDEPDLSDGRSYPTDHRLRVAPLPVRRPAQPIATPRSSDRLSADEKASIPQEPPLGMPEGFLDSMQQEPPFGGIDPNPLGGYAKFRAVMGTGEAGNPPGVNRTAIDAHLENSEGIFNRSAIRGTASTGNAIFGWMPSGSGGRSIYGQSSDGYAVYGFDGGSNPNRGYGGYFYSTNGIGVYGYSGANRTHPNILAPGLYGQSNQGVGVYGRGDTSNSHNFYNEGGYFEGGRGLYARGTDAEFEGGSSLAGYGARFYSNNYRALYALGDSDDYDAHFDGGVGIIVDGIVLAPGTRSLVRNQGAAPIEPGDLVALVGVAPPIDDGPPLLAVARVDANNWDAVVGVAQTTHTAKVLEDIEAGSRTDLLREEGAAPPGSHLTIVTQGLAPIVKPMSPTEVANWRVGEAISLSASGAIVRADGAQDAVPLGKLASLPDPNTGMIAIFVDID